MQILQTKRQKLLIELAELETELKIKCKSHFNLLLSPNLMAKVGAYLKEKDLPNRSLFMEKALEFYMSKNP
ncbi:hypothetical protein [Helicobacter acinonychis]|nr:hypothetical protein [Helicobacter acinonychis]STP03533.1 Uncharacterised protein [Helicobacter acinonychis]